MNIRETFKNDVAKSAFKQVDGTTRIVGKYGEVEEIDGEYDIFFIGLSRTPLSTKRINSLSEKLSKKAVLRVFDDWAYCRGGEELVRFCLPLLGVRKKRQMSESSLKQLEKIRLLKK